MHLQRLFGTLQFALKNAVGNSFGSGLWKREWDKPRMDDKGPTGTEDECPKV